MSRGDSASLCTVRRSRRPQARLETSYTRTGRPRRCLRRTSGRTAGEGSGRTARVHVCEESDSGILPMNHSNKDGRLVGGEGGGKAADQGEDFSILHVPDSERGVYVSHGWASGR